tara:strand:+ start:633 stop:788 length:156 start_codon:yes stop_codon:yes gene_type:complete
MTTYIIDWENETIEGPFRNKNQLIDFLLNKVDGLEFVDTLKEAQESGFERF